LRTTETVVTDTPARIATSLSVDRRIAAMSSSSP
jgi:hypothetical protein